MDTRQDLYADMSPTVAHDSHGIAAAQGRDGVE
jgi:hypothetical protein